ncbi:MAG TPA: copper amine oxidase N-terminal domain-containing protein [Candidatus Monoglobus merdigallinarum]|uniref:Copper amine oxidase N-terminal domain-containing protein n=1 Tax=Candidatus Monoglobus merdigallinarum TaxID=2838698 RepID=A0A9D1TN17_9FIRM|nr:copper amine oxidase N-terminal domain-containing protein [Candidatus Monoglobus merdigallinarum]
MKYKSIIILTVIFSIIASAPAYSADISVYINNDRLELPNAPYLENDRTMVPMRSIFEALGAAVEWNDITSEATALKDGTVITLRIGGTVMFVNGEAVALGAPAALRDDLTYVPLRAVSEALGCEVRWDGESGSVYITSGENIPVSYSGYTNVPDFGALAGVSPVYISGDQTVYVYSGEALPENAESGYEDVMTSRGFEALHGENYTVYTRDNLSVLAGFSGGMFRVVITPY